MEDGTGKEGGVREREKGDRQGWGTGGGLGKVMKIWSPPGVLRLSVLNQGQSLGGGQHQAGQLP